MLYIDHREVQPVPVSEKRPCVLCENRVASWRAETTADGIDCVCGWCLLYGGSTWGVKNKDEILWIGTLVQRMAQEKRGKSTHVPGLDERGRLGPLDAEKLVLGVYFTSRLLSTHLRQGSEQQR